MRWRILVDIFELYCHYALLKGRNRTPLPQEFSEAGKMSTVLNQINDPAPCYHNCFWKAGNSQIHIINSDICLYHSLTQHSWELIKQGHYTNTLHYSNNSAMNISLLDSTLPDCISRGPSITVISLSAVSHDKLIRSTFLYILHHAQSSTICFYWC